MDFKEKTAEELKALSVEELSLYYKELNDSKIKALEAKIEAKADNTEVAEMRKEYWADKEKQFDNLNAKLKEQGLEIAKFKNGDGQTKVSLSDEIVKGFKENIESFKQLKDHKDISRFGFEVASKAAGTITSANITGTLPVVEMIPGMEPIATRKIWLKNAFRKGSVMGNTVAWVDQANRDGTAGSTTEGNTKNLIDYDLVVSTSSLVKYTAYIKISEEMLEDISFMSAEVNNELLVQLDLAVDAALLVLVQAAATAWAAGSFATAVATPTIVDVLMTAKNQIAVANGNATHVLLHPTDVTLIKLEKDANGRPLSGVYYDKDVMFIDNLMVIENSGITQDNFLVFDNSKGTVYTKNKKRIEVGRDGNDFTKNLVTVLAEERDLLVIKTNNKTSFVKGVISTAKTAITLP